MCHFWVPAQHTWPSLSELQLVSFSLYLSGSGLSFCISFTPLWPTWKLCTLMLCARHRSAVYQDPAVCVSPKRGVSPYFTEALWIPGNGLVRGGQGCSPYCSGKSVLFLLRDSVGNHSANPRRGRSNERRLLSGHISCNFSTSWVADMLYLYLFLIHPH